MITEHIKSAESGWVHDLEDLMIRFLLSSQIQLQLARFNVKILQLNDCSVLISWPS